MGARTTVKAERPVLAAARPWLARCRARGSGSRAFETGRGDAGPRRSPSPARILRREAARVRPPSLCSISQLPDQATGGAAFGRKKGRGERWPEAPWARRRGRDRPPPGNRRARWRHGRPRSARRAQDRSWEAAPTRPPPPDQGRSFPRPPTAGPAATPEPPASPGAVPPPHQVGTAVLRWLRLPPSAAARRAPQPPGSAGARRPCDPPPTPWPYYGPV